jgi:hypothetical protein
MIDSSHAYVLKILIPPLEVEPVPAWAITGSLGFALQGMEIAVHDVDLQTDRAGAYEIQRRFSTCVVRPVAFSESERIRSHFGALEIRGVKVEIMGDVQKRLPDGRWEDPVDVTLHRRWVMCEGVRLPVLALEYECQAYLIMGRIERAEMLKKWLDHQKQ